MSSITILKRNELFDARTPLLKRGASPVHDHHLTADLGILRLDTNDRTVYASGIHQNQNFEEVRYTVQQSGDFILRLSQLTDGPSLVKALEDPRFIDLFDELAAAKDRDDSDGIENCLSDIEGFLSQETSLHTYYYSDEEPTTLQPIHPTPPCVRLDVA